MRLTRRWRLQHPCGQTIDVDDAGGFYDPDGAAVTVCPQCGGALARADLHMSAEARAALAAVYAKLLSLSKQQEDET